MVIIYNWSVRARTVTLLLIIIIIIIPSADAVIEHQPRATGRPLPSFSTHNSSDRSLSPDSNFSMSRLSVMDDLQAPLLHSSNNSNNLGMLGSHLRRRFNSDISSYSCITTPRGTNHPGATATTPVGAEGDAPGYSQASCSVVSTSRLNNSLYSALVTPLATVSAGSRTGPDASTLSSQVCRISVLRLQASELFYRVQPQRTVDEL